MSPDHHPFPDPGELVIRRRIGLAVRRWWRPRLAAG
jgi:hypothetical protein